MAKKETQAEMVRKLDTKVSALLSAHNSNVAKTAQMDGRLNLIEAQVPDQAKARLLGIEAKLPQKIVVDNRVIWDPEKNVFMNAWLRDNLPPLPPESEPEPPSVLPIWLATVTLSLVVILGALGFVELRNVKRSIVPVASQVQVHGTTTPQTAATTVTTATATTTTALPISGSIPTSGSITLQGGSHVEHSVELSLTTACWVRVTEETPQARVLIEGFQKNGFAQILEFDEQATLEVRAGCPGDVHYVVNGLPAHPDNVSGTPDKSEVVDLRL